MIADAAPAASHVRSGPSFQRSLAAPMFQERQIARLDADGVARQDVHLNFEIERVAQLQKRRAGRDDGGALLQHAQHAARDRRIDREVPTAGAVRR